ncbi:MAG: hypothetical protein Q8N99_01470 [Nanoarchaeota archaeon]|nr:hypothetical protein [Nanoarchaeota archaeon]
MAGKRLKLSEEKLVERVAVEQYKDDENLGYMFTCDSLASLRDIYGPGIDTLSGCLEVIEGFFIASDGQIPNHKEFKQAYIRFEKLMRESAENGIDTSAYRNAYRRLINMKVRDYDLGEDSSDPDDCKKNQVIARVISHKRLVKIAKKESSKPKEKYVSPTLVYHYNPVNDTFEVG